MARGISKKGKTIEIVSTPLEEFMPINWVVVGRSEWIDSAFVPKALEGIRQVRVSEPSQLHRVKEWLDKHKHHFVDTETTGEDKRSGLDPWHPKSRLLMMQIGNEDLVFIVDPDLVPEFKSHLEDPSYIHVLQNGVFDWKYLFAKYKIHITNIYDTMLAEQLLTSGRLGMPVNLAAISRRRRPYRIITKSVRKEFIEFKGKFTPEMVYYAARDIILLPPIMQHQLEELQKYEMMTVAQDEFNCIPVTGSMELGGVPFSEKTLRLSLLYWTQRQKDLESQILREYDRRMSQSGASTGFLLDDMKFEFDVSSSTQKLEALRSLGLTIDDVKRDTLQELNDPIAALMGEYSECVKVTSTYGENMINRINPATGRLQVEFNQLGHGDIEAKAGKATTIATGRYSSDFQQLPRAKSLYELVHGDELQTVKAQFADKIALLLKEAAA